MSRKAFDKLCTIYRGASETKADVPFAEHIDCGLIVQDGIFAFGTDSLPIDYYLTIQDVPPVGSWVPGGSIDLVVGDWIEIEEPGFPLFTVVYVRYVDWRSEIDYYQGHLVPFRRVRRIGSGGIIIGGSADVHTSWVGAGGVVCGGIAIVDYVHRMSVVGSGGIRLGGDGCPYSTVIVHNSHTTDITGEGGVLIGGYANISTTPGGQWLYDGFSHDSGSTLDGTSLESGSGLPATWTHFNQNFYGAGTEATENGVVSDIFLPGGLVTEAANSDGTAECGVYHVPASGAFACGMILRYLDDDNFLDWQYDTTTGTLAFYEFVGGSPTALNSTGASISTSSSSPSILRAVMNGTSIDCYLNGTVLYTITDNYNYTNTQHGIMGYRRTATLPGYGNYTYWQFDL